MERKDWIFSIILAVAIGHITFSFNLDYYDIAEVGTTLTSIVLAVYMSAIIGLINTNLAKQMALQAAPKQKDKSQLGVLVLYFKIAISFAIITIILSSVVLLIYDNGITTTLLYRILSSLSFISYSENLLFLIIVIRFILNRQIWNR